MSAILLINRDDDEAAGMCSNNRTSQSQVRSDVIRLSVQESMFF